MLVCVLVLTVGTIYLLAQTPPTINAAITQSQNRLADGIIKGVVGVTDANLLVLSRTGNIAQNSTIPCCANAGVGGCGKDVKNCTYSKGDGLACFSQLFDTENGSCAQ